ncbi:MAG: decarboxylating 6-phosphogluconate dehydrogenase [bacterium]|nr:decarboxylating 6-phosphogluconate dehydrogenase [bacterium]
MELGIIGLGRMGGNMVQRLLGGGHRVVVFDQSAEAVAASAALGAVGADSLAHMAAQMTAPRAVWVMVPSGDPTEETIAQMTQFLDKGDTVIDGGNSNYKDTIRRAQALKEGGFHMIDSGTSGGIWGLKEGYSLMIGGDDAAVARLGPIFETLAPASDRGWGHVGPSGAGHFTKMIHNGIEYGMMQAFAEGFELLKGRKEFDLDLHQISRIWQHGSVVRSWLLDLIADALEEDQDLSGLAPYVSDSGEGRWTVAEAIEQDVPAPVITMSLMMRFVSRQNDSYAAKLLAAMRNQFGGHAVKKAE